MDKRAFSITTNRKFASLETVNQRFASVKGGRTFAGSIILLLDAVLLVVVSCYWQPNAVSGTGDIALTLAGGGNGSAVSRAFTGTGVTHARVFLKTMADAGEILYLLDPSGGKSYLQLELSSGSPAVLTIPDVPATHRYRLLLTLGIYAEGYFDVIGYGESEPFTVFPGQTADTVITVKDTPFTKSSILKGMEITGLVVDSYPKIYASTSTTLYTGTDATNLTAEAATLAPGATINSLSLCNFFGAEEVWLNTTKGIAPFRLGSFDETFTQNLSATVSVSQSGSFPVGSDLLVLFQGDAKLGGVYITVAQKDTPDVWPWAPVVDLRTYLTGQPVVDFLVSESFGYFATKLGAFRLSKDLIKEQNTTELLDLATFFSVPGSDGKEIPILSLGRIGNYLYLGTANGIWKADLSESDAEHAIVVASLSQLSGTSGKFIKRIKVAGDASYIAFLGESDLFILHGDALSTFPFYSGLPGDQPGDLKDLAWLEKGADWFLLVSGNKGLVSLPMAVIP